MVAYLALLAAGFAAGVQNALAGGGSFLTFPALLLAGLDPRAANITSTIALFPGQMTTGWAGRRHVSGAENLSFRVLVAISLVGGLLGALLLLATSPAFFARLVPYLILFATLLFAWGSFMHRPAAGGAARLGRTGAMLAQFGIAIYGGYFGGGIGFLMLAALTLAGLAVRTAASTKNVLAAAMNASAVVVFLFSPDVHWAAAVALGIGAIAGGQIGAWLLRWVNDRWLRAGIVLIGAVLTVAMFARQP
jgi:uncharacterized membrane protein YfcA